MAHRAQLLLLHQLAYEHGCSGFQSARVCHPPIPRPLWRLELTSLVCLLSLNAVFIAMVMQPVEQPLGHQHYSDCRLRYLLRVSVSECPW